MIETTSNEYKEKKHNPCINYVAKCTCWSSQFECSLCRISNKHACSKKIVFDVGHREQFPKTLQNVDGNDKSRKKNRAPILAETWVDWFLVEELCHWCYASRGMAGKLSNVQR